MRHLALKPALIIAAVLGVGAAANARAQARRDSSAKPVETGLKVPPYRFRFLGVYDDDSGEPLPDAEVADAITGVSSRTSKTGTVSLFFIPDGGGIVRIRKPGYEMQTLTVPISPSDTTPVTVTLKKAVTLATVTVKESAPVYLSPRLRGAVERMKSGQGGYFIDEATMRKHDGSTLANAMIGNINGILPTIDKRGQEHFVSSRTPCLHGIMCGAPDCFIQTFVDGVPSALPVSFTREHPDDYAIAEFYPGGASVPVEYASQGGDRCGVLLLWTRER